jgi:hypothetical protein
MSAWKELAVAVWRLLRAWWTVDRIRVSKEDHRSKPP